MVTCGLGLLLFGVFWFLWLGSDQFQRLGDLWGGGRDDVSDCVVTGLVGVVLDFDWSTIVTDVGVRSFDHLDCVFGSGVLHVSGSLGDDTVLGFESEMHANVSMVYKKYNFDVHAPCGAALSLYLIRHLRCCRKPIK